VSGRFLVQLFQGAVPAASRRLARTPDAEKGGSETLVTDGPHMERAIRLEYETEWDGTRGTVRVEDAWLE
jgi:diphthamide synthase (EF-2-diphthine--ammonia ligase)